MVLGVIARGISEVARAYGPGLVKRGLQSFRKYDVKIHRNLYGKSGGRGVRHGRDAGSIIAGLYQGTRRGDDLDPIPQGLRDPSSTKSQAYSRRSNQRSSGRRVKCSCDHCRRYGSTSRKSYRR